MTQKRVIFRERLGLRVPDGYLDAVTEAAKAHNETPAEYVRRVVTEAMRREGVQTPALA